MAEQQGLKGLPPTVPYQLVAPPVPKLPPDARVQCLGAQETWCSKYHLFSPKSNLRSDQKAARDIVAPRYTWVDNV